MDRIPWSVDVIHPLSSSTLAIVKWDSETENLGCGDGAISIHFLTATAAIKYQNHTHNRDQYWASLQKLPWGDHRLFHGRLISLNLRPWKGKLSQLGLTFISGMDFPFISTVPHPTLLSEVSKDVSSTAIDGVHNPPLPQTPPHLTAQKIQHMTMAGPLVLPRTTVQYP